MPLSKEEKQEATKKFGKTDVDTGSPEVQIAMLTDAHQRPDRASADALRRITTRAAVC